MTTPRQRDQVSQSCREASILPDTKQQSNLDVQLMSGKAAIESFRDDINADYTAKSYLYVPVNSQSHGSKPHDHRILSSGCAPGLGDSGTIVLKRSGNEVSATLLHGN